MWCIGVKSGILMPRHFSVENRKSVEREYFLIGNSPLVSIHIVIIYTTGYRERCDMKIHLTFAVKFKRKLVRIDVSL